MLEVKGDLWDYWRAGDWVALTTNGQVKLNGEAVMGAGIAKVARDKFEGLSEEIGMHLQLNGNVPGLFLKFRIVSFPTKDHWKDKSDLGLIRISALDLVKLVDDSGYDIKRIALPRPGCGNGGLRWMDVKPLIVDILDDRFVVVKYEKKRLIIPSTAGNTPYEMREYGEREEEEIPDDA